MNPIDYLIGGSKIAGAIALAVTCFWICYKLIAPLVFRLVSPVFGQFPSLLASRYLFAKKERNAIHIITLIAITGTLVVTAALIITLSVFNGFQGLIHNRYGLFDPDIRVSPEVGRTFTYSEDTLNLIRKMEGVEYASAVIENKAIITYGDKQQLITAKGVKEDYLKVKAIDKLVYEGSYSFKNSRGKPRSVLGGTVAYYLTALYTNPDRKATLWAALDQADPLKNPETAIDSEKVEVAGYFKTTMEYDAQYILIDYKLAEDLFKYAGLCTSYEVKIKAGYSPEEVKGRLAAILPGGIRVQTLYDQHESLYVVMKNEKFIAYLILTLMLIITGVNIVGSLSMIVVEKTRDIAVLKSFGATRGQIRKAFMLEGIMVGGIGGMAGMLAAFIFGICQQTFGILRVNGGETFQEIPFFPHEMHVSDFIVIFFTVFTFSVLAAIYPAIKASSAPIVASMRK